MSKYIVGIDLGTTNCVLAYCVQSQARVRQIRLLQLEQLVAPGEVQALPLLPSVRYHPVAGELAAQELDLPWAAGDANAPVFGRFARQLGMQVPGRLVSSAKSWLSHPAVDRSAAILPWDAPPEVAKVSPLQASCSYLEYLRAAWDMQYPQAPLAKQELVLTVPASFDEGARALTMEAAHLAGLPKVRLLEEPQAAFHDWIYRQQEALADALQNSRLVLVADVGGGTTDFSLISVQHTANGVQLNRIGVGNHLMLGGDNMDLALAHLVEQRLRQSSQPSGGAPRLSASRLAQLMERCRAAKEILLAADAPETCKVTLLGGGSGLISGSRSVELTQADVRNLILDGFFPQVPASEGPQRPSKRGGMQELGLPYASDAAITRHLAGFLQQHSSAIRTALGHAADSELPAIPDTLLLNGGVFRADALAQRLAAVLGGWRGAALTVLHNDNPDVAVARGAVAYALAGQGRSTKIGGGSARSFYLLVDAGKHAAQQAICILPRGTEAGQEQLLTSHSFALRLGQPVQFHLVSKAAEQHAAQLGHQFSLDTAAAEPSEPIVPLPPLATVLQAPPGWPAIKKEIPVQLATCLTELGSLEMYCVAQTENGAHRWRLQFQLRSQTTQPKDAGQDNLHTLPAQLPQALEKIERVFGNRKLPIDVKEVRQLRNTLEQLLGRRENWATPLLRTLFDALWQRQKARRRSAEHEMQWLNLIGYCLRPGFGDPLDAWRIQQLWPIFDQGVQFRQVAQVGVQWWTLWRRVAGGLDAAAQQRLLEDFALILQGSAEDLAAQPHTVPGDYADMLRLAAALERIPAAYKIEIGDWIMQQAGQAERPRQDILYWALARVGARQPAYGNWEQVVPPSHATQWLEALLQLDWRKQESPAFAASHLCRLCGERSRDIEDALRQRVADKLRVSLSPPAWIEMVLELVQLDEAATSRLFGEALPPGLKLLRA